MAIEPQPIISTRFRNETSGGAIDRSFYQDIWGNTDVFTNYGGRTMFAIAGTMVRLYVKLSRPPGEGKYYTVVLRKGYVDTSLSVTISGASDIDGYSEGSVDIVPGDLLRYRIRHDDDTVIHIGASLVFCPNNFREYHMGGGGIPDNVAWWLSLMGTGGTYSGVPARAIGSQRFLSPDIGLLKNLIFTRNAPVPAGQSQTIVIVKNGVDTDLSVTLNEGETYKENTFDWASVDIFDLLCARLTNGIGSYSTIRFSVVFEPYSNGSVFGGTYYYYNEDLPSYTPIIGHNPTRAEANEDLDVLSDDLMVKHMYVHLDTAPGEGNSRTVTLVYYVDDVEYPTGMVLSFVGNIYQSVSPAVVVAPKGSFLRLKWTKTGSPAQTGAAFGFLGYATYAYGSNIITPNVRVSSIRRLYQPGLYRMEMDVGDLGLNIDIPEVAITQVPEEIREN